MACGPRFVFGGHEEVAPRRPRSDVGRFSVPALAWEYVQQRPAFLEDEVATVRLTLSENDWAFILNPDNAYSNQEWPATFVYESSAGIDTVENGVRLRGNTARGGQKAPGGFNTFTERQLE